MTLILTTDIQIITSNHLITTTHTPPPKMSRYNPATRPESIEALISGVDRYNPHNLPLLHDYIEAQLKGEYDWDCMAALAVLKL